MRIYHYLIMFSLISVLLLSGCSREENNSPTTPSKVSEGVSKQKEEFISLLRLSNSSLGKNTYQGERVTGDTKTPFSLIRYSDGSRTRTDMFIQKNEIRSFTIGGMLTTCNKAPTPNAPWACREVPLPQVERAATIFDDSSLFDVTVAGETTAAALTGQCYEIVKKDGTEQGKTCITRNGVLLYNELKNQYLYTTQALTARENTVKDDDFLPPNR